MINAQKHYGLDVLTRITYEYEHPETGVKDLQEAIVQSVNGMIGEVCEEAGVSREEIREIDVAANCTMTHMLLGVDARSIAGPRTGRSLRRHRNFLHPGSASKQEKIRFFTAFLRCRPT